MINNETERICRGCCLPFSNLSFGGYYLCSYCDRGIFRDGSRWSYEEAVNEKMRKEKAKLIYEKIKNGSQNKEDK